MTTNHKSRRIARALEVCWHDEPREHEYRSAGAFLSLMLPDEVAQEALRRFRRAPVEWRQAKDLIRASGLDAVAVDNPKVRKKITKLRAGKRLAPVLLVRGSLPSGRHLTIADGFHRICAAVAVAPGTAIPCKLVDLPIAVALDAGRWVPWPSTQLSDLPVADLARRGTPGCL